MQKTLCVFTTEIYAHILHVTWIYTVSRIRLFSNPFTTHAAPDFTWIFMKHTCTSSDPHHHTLLKHTPHLSQVSDLVSTLLDSSFLLIIHCGY